MKHITSASMSFFSLQSADSTGKVDSHCLESTAALPRTASLNTTAVESESTPSAHTPNTALLLCELKGQRRSSQVGGCPDCVFLTRKVRGGPAWPGDATHRHQSLGKCDSCAACFYTQHIIQHANEPSVRAFTVLWVE